LGESPTISDKLVITFVTYLYSRLVELKKKEKELWKIPVQPLAYTDYISAHIDPQYLPPKVIENDSEIIPVQPLASENDTKIIPVQPLASEAKITPVQPLASENDFQKKSLQPLAYTNHINPQYLPPKIIENDTKITSVQPLAGEMNDIIWKMQYLDFN